MSGIARMYQALRRAEELLSQWCMVASVVVVFLGAVARSVGRPLSWSMDVATFLFAWATFFAVDVAWRRDRHVAVELFVNLLPKKARAAIALLNHVIILAYLCFLVWYGIQMTYITRFRTFQGIPGFSYLWVTLAVPVGGFLTALTAAGKCWRLGRELIDEFRGPGAGKGVAA